jgi:hypothetical protein
MTEHTQTTTRDIAVILPYAVSIRDFVTTGCLGLLADDPDVSVTVYTLNPELPELEHLQARGVKVLELAPYKDNRAEAALKGLYLYGFSDKFAYIEQHLADRPLRRFVAKSIGMMRRMIGTARFLRLFERLMLALYRRRGHLRQLQGHPALVIGTRSLMNSIDYGLIAEARTRDIPILTLAGSWDNFTTKGFFPFKAENIVVWNEKMAAELDEIFAVDRSRVVIVGYPRQSVLRSLAEGPDAENYLRQLGHGKFRRFVLYSASYSELTHFPGDPYPLEYQVMAQVSERLEQVLPEDVCILIRLHPFSDPDGKTAFDGLSRSFVFVPGRKDKYVERVMGPEDEAHLARQIALSECVVSLASTMTIDALTLEKPVINTTFDPRPDIPFINSNRRFYQYNHFKDLVEITKLPMAHTPQEVANFVLGASKKPLSEQVDMQAFERWYVPAYSKDYPRHVHGMVREVLDRHQAAR